MLRTIIMVTVLAVALLFGQSFADVINGDVANESLAHTVTLFFHQLLLVYWLGPDIAVFIWSRSAVNPQLTVEQRVTAGKMMAQIDLVPRVCLSLFLTVAGILSDTYGLPHPWWQMAGIILLGPVWLTIVLLTYINEGNEFGATVAKLDLILRGILVVGIPVSVAYSLATDRLVDAPWIAGKLMALAGIILLGLLMRLRFRAFFTGLDRLEKEGQSDDVDQQMAGSLAKTRPYVHGIWVLLLLASMAGIVKPGDQVDRPGEVADQVSALVD
ncbi:MAG: hypothetical protein OEU86_07190 [Gammaproteobacteria bacterium]|nr:hypothetical protein [Gammaproteobacteria bacterium]